MANESLTLPCPAKVNLALSVGPPDRRGYHPIASWMVALDWGDQLTVTRLRDGEASGFDVAYAADAPRREPIDWPLERDLACRAHRALEAHVGRPLPVSVKLRKRVPTGAGLGGGSSDAGAMLVGLDRLFSLQLTAVQLATIGATLGSDVSFAVGAAAGRAAALVSGLGERIAWLDLPTPLHLVLLLPPMRCPTGPVYAAFDRMAADGRVSAVGADESRVHGLSASGSAVTGLFNDLAEPAMHVAPGLRSVRDRAAEAIGDAVHVTGSGAGLFCVVSSREAGEAAAGRLRVALPQVPVVVTRTLLRTNQAASDGR
jgi:4-diphosphocytidyl-2-C-methyl-D-erythritol kinase